LRRFFISMGFLVALLAAACGKGDLTLEEADPASVADVPTWDQVYGIFQRECVPCHTGDSPAGDNLRYGASAPQEGTSPGLETCQSIIDNFARSYERIFVQNDMPPGAWPRLTSEQKLIIQRWFDEGGDAPCK